MGDPKLGKLRGRYNIEAWGERLGIPKIGIDITDWSHWTPEMQERCVGDTAICKALWRLLQPDGYSQRAIELEHRAAAICDEITAAGAPFDATAAAELHRQWAERRSALAAQLQQQFPGVKLSSRKQIGALLEARGWAPERRTEKTKQPKIDAALLETIPEIYPEFAGLAEYMLLGRLLASLTTGKKAWREHIGADGRIHGGVIHIGTPHSRAKHLEPNLAAVPIRKRVVRSVPNAAAYSAPATAGCASPPTRPGFRTAALPTTCNPSTAAPMRRPSSPRRIRTGNRRRPRFGG